jgi:hypothetical protein
MEKIDPFHPEIHPGRRRRLDKHFAKFPKWLMVPTAAKVPTKGLQFQRYLGKNHYTVLVANKSIRGENKTLDKPGVDSGGVAKI